MAAPVPIFTSTVIHPAMLTNPLSVRATVLRKPEMLDQVAEPELTEEGDILHEVLASPLVIDRTTKRRGAGRWHNPSATIVVAANGAEDGEFRSADSSVTAMASSCGGGDSSGGALARPSGERAVLPVSHYFGINPVVALPTKLGKYFAGEVFRAYLSFFNAATYPLTRLLFRIEAINPQQQRIPLFDNETYQIGSKANQDVKVELRLVDAGQHTISVTVSYVDAALEAKRLTWASTFQVGRAISEVARSIRVATVPLRLGHDPLNPLRVKSHTVEEIEQNVKLPSRKYVFRMALQNTSGSPIVLSNVRFVVNESAFALLPSPVSDRAALPPQRSSTGAPAAAAAAFLGNAAAPPSAATMEVFYLSSSTRAAASSLKSSSSPSATSTSAAGMSFQQHYTGGGRDSLVDIHMNPGDCRQFLAELVHTVPVHVLIANRNVSNGNGSLAQRKTTLSSLGEAQTGRVVVESSAGLTMQTTSSGVAVPGGRVTDSTLMRSFASCSPPPSLTSAVEATPAHVMLPLHVAEMGHVEWEWRRSSGDSGTDTSSVIRLGAMHKEPLLDMFVMAVTPSAPVVGVPLTLELLIVNTSPSQAVDVAVKIRPECLAPCFVYCGPMTRPLGFAEPSSGMRFTLTLTPWRSGWVTIHGGSATAHLHDGYASLISSCDGTADLSGAAHDSVEASASAPALFGGAMAEAVHAIASGIELCDARYPDVLLWPLRPLQAHTPNAAGNTTGQIQSMVSPHGLVQAAVVPPDVPYPPLLCELLIQ